MRLGGSYIDNNNDREPHFQIGDRVEVIAKQQTFETVGLVGTVVANEENDEYPGSVAVMHDRKIRRASPLI